MSSETLDSSSEQNNTQDTKEPSSPLPNFKRAAIRNSRKPRTTKNFDSHIDATTGRNEMQNGNSDEKEIHDEERLKEEKEKEPDGDPTEERRMYQNGRDDTVKTPVTEDSKHFEDDDDPIPPEQRALKKQQTLAKLVKLGGERAHLAAILAGASPTQVGHLRKVEPQVKEDKHEEVPEWKAKADAVHVRNQQRAHFETSARGDDGDEIVQRKLLSRGSGSFSNSYYRLHLQPQEAERYHASRTRGDCCTCTVM